MRVIKLAVNQQLNVGGGKQPGRGHCSSIRFVVM